VDVSGGLLHRKVTSMEKPRLRPVEIIPVVHENRRMFHLYDPSGVGEGLLLSPGAVQIAVSYFNGENTVRDIQAAFLRRTGSLLSSEDLNRLIAALDEAGLLDSDNFRKRLQARREAYLAEPLRPATHAGGAYPADPTELKERLREILRKAEEKGARPVENLRALVAPHIDFVRGSMGYGYAYSALQGRRPPERVIVLGTGHHVTSRPIVLTEKDFATPLGVVKTDRGLVKRLTEACGPEILEDQFEHATEHSVEFQAVLLRYLFGGKFSLVPVLCGAFPTPEPGGKLPREVPLIERFIEELRAIVGEAAEETLVVAGVDFAHVGPRFGAEEPVDEALLTAVEVSDRALLASLCQGDADGFYRRLGTHGNKYGVCGYAAMYTLLAALPGLQGVVLHYEQAVAPDRSQAVTFSAVAFK